MNPKALYIGLFFLAVQSIFAQADSLLIVETSLAAGFYEEGFELELMANDPEATIYYTLDGSAPLRGAKKYEEPIQIEKTTVLKAVAKKEKEESKAIVATFFVDEPKTQLPIISISIKPSILFNYGTGLFRKGPKASKSFPYKGANFYSKREYACRVEIFESDKERVFAGTLGLKVFGGMSRIFPQKSLALYARKKYGNKWIRHPIFPNRKLKKYKRLVLRNSGSDYGETHFRDGFITGLADEAGLPVQAYRPSLVYINGRYWGVMNIREKLTKHYFQQHFDHDKDSIDLMEHSRYVQAGSRSHYQMMQRYMQRHNLAEEEHYEAVRQMMDVQNFMEYYIFQIYMDNQDAGGNIKYWRPQADTGRWRWVLFDTDFGFGHYSKGGYHFNSVNFHTKANGPKWPNPPWSTVNLRMLLKNEGFKKQFVQRFCDRMNGVFQPQYVLNRIDSMVAVIKPEMDRHWLRWGLNPEDWAFRVEQMREFAVKRPAYVRKHLHQKFPELGEPVQLKIEVKGKGHLQLNEVIAIGDTFSGWYFKELEVYLKADAYFGSQFSHWEWNGQKIEGRFLHLNFNQTENQLKAVFKKGEHPKAKQLIINEISPRDTLVSDWVEFYNSTDEDLNLENWYLLDEKDNKYVFPNITIKGKSYLVLCQDIQKFRKVFKVQENVLTGLNFGLGAKSDRLELYTPDGEPVDSVAYDIGKSKDSILLVLALRDFESDNSNFKKNWKYDKYGGSPASMNPHYLKWKNKAASAAGEGDNLNSFMDAVMVALYTVGGFVLILILMIIFRKRKLT